MLMATCSLTHAFVILFFFFLRTFDASHRRKKNAMATLLLKIIERAQFNCEAPQATTKQTLQIDVQLAALFLRVELH